MQYLKITNKGAVNRRLFELIGVSTKRDRFDDPGVIGQKGSGTKLAAVAALRLGIDLTIASGDGEGNYLLRFETRPFNVDGRVFNRVCFTFVNESDDPKGSLVVRRESNLVVESFSGWDQPIGADDYAAFKVLREFICNAYDEDKEFMVSEVDKIGFSPKGETAVYLSYKPEIKAMLAEPRRYFKFMATGQTYLSVDGIGDVYFKSEKDKTRLFMLGVLVDCSAAPERSSIFDYSLRNKHLISEERTITDFTFYRLELGRLFGRITDPGFIDIVLAKAGTESARIEDGILGNIVFSDEGKAAWLAGIHRKYGEKVATASGNAQLDLDADQIYQYTVIDVRSASLRSFFFRLGVPSASDAVPKAPPHKAVRFGDLEPASQKDFADAFRMFARHCSEYAKYRIGFYLPLGGRGNRIFGFAFHATGADKEIWIAAKSETQLESVEEILKTLVHEARHCHTEAGDYDRAFMNRADDEIATLIFRSERRKTFSAGKLVPPSGDPDARPNLISSDK